MVTLLNLGFFGFGVKKIERGRRRNVNERFSSEYEVTVTLMGLFSHLLLKKSVRANHVPHYYNVYNTLII